MNNKKGLACLKLERINKSINANEDDITVRHATFSILDFSESGNHQIVTEDECLKSSRDFNKSEYYDDLTLKDGYIPKIDIKEFEDGGDYLIIEVIDDYQMVRCQYSWILY